jgi:hypothetical protein
VAAVRLDSVTDRGSGERDERVHHRCSQVAGLLLPGGIGLGLLGSVRRRLVGKDARRDAKDLVLLGLGVLATGSW